MGFGIDGFEGRYYLGRVVFKEMKAKGATARAGHLVVIQPGALELSAVLSHRGAQRFDPLARVAAFALRQQIAAAER